MANHSAIEKKIINLARRLGVLRVHDLTQQCIHPEYLRRMCQQGIIQRIERGLYKLSNAEVSEHYHLAQLATWIPHGVICLISALRFHEIGTQSPQQVWLALERGKANPRIKTVPLQIVRFSKDAFSKGIEDHPIDGVKVRIYSAAKTVADCFKFRNKIGTDVAVEALREGLRDKKINRDQLWHYSGICRVRNVMRPYLEAIS